MENRMDRQVLPTISSAKYAAQLVLAQPCSSKQAASIAQCGHEHHHDGVSNGMPIECQWHDDARRQKRNIQHGEHGNRNMAQTAMGYLSLLMVERRFESCAGIGMGKFVATASEMRLPNVTLALAAIATITRDASTHTVMATI